MRRRRFIAILGAAAAAYPLGAQAQQKPVIGFLHSGSRASYGHVVDAFLRGLSDGGFPESAVTIEYRWADDRFDRLPALAQELVRQNVAAIFAGGGEVSAVAAKSATSTIPVVFAIGADPVQHGIVASLNRPGGNVTGVSFLVVQVRPKMVELARELLPQAKTMAILVNANRLGAEQGLNDVVNLAKAAGFEVVVHKAGNEREIDVAFAALRGTKVDVVLLLSDPVYINRREQIARLLEMQKLPSIQASREHVVAGSLISYGANLGESVQQAGAYTARVLKGEKPANLPVMQPTMFEMVINLKTAKALGLTVPPTLLARADEVIE